MVVLSCMTVELCRGKESLGSERFGSVFYSSWWAVSAAICMFLPKAFTSEPRGV